MEVVGQDAVEADVRVHDERDGQNTVNDWAVTGNRRRSGHREQCGAEQALESPVVRAMRLVRRRVLGCTRESTLVRLTDWAR